MSATVKGAISKAARIQIITDLCATKGRSSEELADAIGTTKDNLRTYINPMIAAGNLFKCRSTDTGELVVFYAATMELARGAVGCNVCIIRKTWTVKSPPMFAPMAFLFGRATT